MASHDLRAKGNKIEKVEAIVYETVHIVWLGEIFLHIDISSQGTWQWHNWSQIFRSPKRHYQIDFWSSCATLRSLLLSFFFHFFSCFEISFFLFRPRRLGQNIWCFSVLLSYYKAMSIFLTVCKVCDSWLIHSIYREMVSTLVIENITCK